MAFVVFVSILRERYGRDADVVERFFELLLTAILVLIIFSPRISFRPWFVFAVSSLATAVITFQSLISEWHCWADDPISIPRGKLLTSFFLASLVSFPSIAALSYFIFSLKVTPVLFIISLDFLEILLFSQIKSQKSPQTVMVKKPILSGWGALTELKYLRFHYVFNSLPYGVVFLIIGSLYSATLELQISLLGWFLLGISYGLFVPIIYHEREDPESAFIRRSVLFHEFTSYLAFLIPSFICAIVAASLLEFPALVLINALIVVCGYLLGNVIPIFPRFRLRFVEVDPREKPTLAADFLVQCILMVSWCALFFSYQYVTH